MRRPVIHLICNAHLDPVRQWRWEEGASEAITTFGIVNSGQYGFDLKDGEVRLTFRPYQIKRIRFERDGSWNEVPMIEEE